MNVGFRWPGEDFPTINQDMLIFRLILSLHVLSVYVLLLAWLTLYKGLFVCWSFYDFTKAKCAVSVDTGLLIFNSHYNM